MFDRSLITLTLVMLPLGCLSATKQKGDGEDEPAPPQIRDPGTSTTAIDLSPDTPTCPADLDETEVPDRALEVPTGWASGDALGFNGTSGGSEGDVVVARSLDELATHVENPAQLIIKVCGQLGDESSVGRRIEIGTSNKTLIGVGTRPTLMASIEVSDTANVIVRDIYVRGADPDGVAVRRSHHVWIDHVDLSNSLDGNLDITNEADYVTVSWSRFYYTDAVTNPSHRFSNLIGSSDSATADTGKLRVTMHHNWWADNVHERMPRARFGKIHVYNNYYSSRDNNYCIRAGVESELLVEKNFFNRVNTPYEVAGAHSLAQVDNVFLQATRGQTLGEAFAPDYEYDADPARYVAELVMLGSGPGRSASLDDIELDENGRE